MDFLMVKRFRKYDFKDNDSIEEKREAIKENAGKMVLVQNSALDNFLDIYSLGEIKHDFQDENSYVLAGEKELEIMKYEDLEKLFLEVD